LVKNLTGPSFKFFNDFGSLEKILDLDKKTVEELRRDIILNRNDPSIRLLNILKTRTQQLELSRLVHRMQEDKINDLRSVIDSLKKKVIGVVGYTHESSNSQNNLAGEQISMRAISKLHRFVEKIEAYQVNESSANLTTIFQSVSKKLRVNLERSFQIPIPVSLFQNQINLLEAVEQQDPYTRAERNFLTFKSHSVTEFNRINSRNNQTGKPR
jgi:hypothetical protein